MKIESWIKQLNMYRWLLQDCYDKDGNHHQFNIDLLRVVCLSFKSVKKLKVPLRDLAEIETMIQESVGEFKKSLKTDTLPLPQSPYNPYVFILCTNYCSVRNECLARLPGDKNG